MKPEIKAKWLEALRSGEYHQTVNGELRNNDMPNHFCCLGVLCELHRKEHPELGAEWVANNDQTYSQQYLGEGCYPPAEVLEWAGLEQRNPHMAVGDDEGSGLADLNDGGKSFTELADMIEEQL